VNFIEGNLTKVDGMIYLVTPHGSTHATKRTKQEYKKDVPRNEIQGDVHIIIIVVLNFK
jgi:FtsZ-interacting cell division protein YlmF